MSVSGKQDDRSIVLPTVWERKLGGETAHTCAVSPDGKYIICGSGGTESDSCYSSDSYSGTLRKLNVRTGAVEWTVARSDQVRTCAFSNDGRFVLCGGDDNKLVKLEAESGKEVWSVTRG